MTPYTQPNTYKWKKSKLSMKLTITPNEMCETNERGDLLLLAWRGCF